ncbi:hypothetical protein HD597_010060 [Nonomuraea thailandensis]|uniref:Uncharacterized protein n=1 Tax=Nonomuraea thailandensis TaxID=1188745 RepID=A0A9X2K7X0_9ACTN|nr:hypothetical protein [Nonomuraea thailandensis]MCP2363040.1 hypothetical protein [Nonomuraea thailandensis]
MTNTMTEQPLLNASLSAYRLAPGLRLSDESTFLELRCPHTITQIGRRRTDPRRCVTNLLAEQARTRAIELGTLVTVAMFHDDPEPSLERTTRVGVLHRELGELVGYTLHHDLDEHPFLVMNCPYRGGRCPGSENGECATNLIPQGSGPVDLGTLLQLATAHENARYGVPAERLAALRKDLVRRQQDEIYTRETADGESAGIASTRADIYRQVIAQLDQVVQGG